MTQPALYYDNRFADATPVASTTAAGYAVANLLDWRPYTWWQPTAIPATVTVDCGRARAADYALVVGHDLGSTGHRIQVRGSTDNFAASDVLLASQATDNDRALLVPFTSAEYRYWRLRVASANLLTYSEQFDHASWTKTAAAVIADQATGLAGLATADKINDTTANSQHHIGKTSAESVSAGSVVTLVFWASAGERSNFALYLSGTAFGGVFAGAVFNVSTGVAGTKSAGITSAIEAIGGGVYRCTVQRTATASGTVNVSVYHASSNTDIAAAAYIGTGTGFYGHGIMLAETSVADEPYVATAAALTSGTPSLAIAAIGAALTLPTWLPQGFDAMGRKIEGETLRNARGQPMGRVIEAETWEQSIDLQRVSWDWLRDTWLPAWRTHLRDSPFGFCWSPSTHADEVRLVTAGEEFTTPHYAGSTADLRVTLSGVAE